MPFSAIFVTVVLGCMLVALSKDVLRPGLILLSAAVIFMCAGILTPSEMLAGFSNKGMITVAMLFLISEGVRRSGLLEQALFRLLPQRKASVASVQLRMIPVVSFISAFLNNTPVVVIFAPMLKRWAERMKQPATKLLIPLSYATILGGMCTLIGTSTNLVVHGMALNAAEQDPDSGVRGLTMFELGQVGIFLVVAGTLYMVLASRFLLPNRREQPSDVLTEESDSRFFRVEVVLGSRFPAVGRAIRNFDFKKKYGALMLELKRGGERYIIHDLRKEKFREGDTLVLLADDTFIQNWGDSSFFLMVNDLRQSEPKMGTRKRWLTVVLVVLMILGATLGELPAVREWVPDLRLDMFFFACVTVVIMAWGNMFPARKYTKFISWDILLTISSAFAISKAMQKSGMADMIGSWATELGEMYSPQVLLGVIFVLTVLCTELMTNNAAAALAFPIALSVAQHLEVSPMPFIVAICIAASASFCTPIGYQTNLIVQSVGGYRFSDFFKVGFPLSLIVFALSMWLIPVFWPF